MPRPYAKLDFEDDPMTPTIWAIAIATGAIITTILAVGSDIGKKLDVIARVTTYANEMTRENRTGEWRDR